VRDSLVDPEYPAWLHLLRTPIEKHMGRRGKRFLRDKSGVFSHDQGPPFTLQLQSVVAALGRRKLEVPDHGARLVDSSIAALPKPQTVINLFVVGRSKFTIEAA